MAAIKYVFAKDAAGLEKIQNVAIKSVAKARIQVQIAAVATIRHAYEHGDWTYAQKLVTGLGNTVNGAALVEWFKQYGGLKADETGFIGWSGKDYIQQNFEQAKGKMWWELKAKNPFAGYSLEQALQKIIKDHNTMKEKVVGLTEEDQKKVDFKVNDETIKAVLKLCNFEAIMEDSVEEEVKKAVA